jgi:hypothetical protein
MGIPAFNIKYTYWHAWKSCVIEDGIIYPFPESTNTMDTWEKHWRHYDVFDYYSSDPDKLQSDIPEKLVSYILMDNKKELRKMSLNHLFASLDVSSMEQIRRFVEVFGPLYYGDKRDVRRFPYGWVRPASMVREYLRLPVKVIQSEHAEFTQLLDNLELFHKIKENKCRSTKKEFEELQWGIEADFANYLDQINPVLVMDDGNVEWTWNFPTMLHALYFMSFMDFATRGVPLKCADPYCNNIFFPIQRCNETLYCSQTCKNRVDQRNNAARKKAVRALWREGKSPEEIMNQTGLEVEKITRWISTFKR